MIPVKTRAIGETLTKTTRPERILIVMKVATTIPEVHEVKEAPLPTAK
jgi:hypothetical protein